MPEQNHEILPPNMQRLTLAIIVTALLTMHPSASAESEQPIGVVESLVPQPREPLDDMLSTKKAPGDKPDPKYELVWQDNFNKDTPRPIWHVIDDPDHPTWEQFWPGGIQMSDGQLRITSRRHCSPTGQLHIQSLDNHHIQPCPSGYDTFYSSGRIETDNFLTPELINHGGKIEVKAKLPSNLTPGTAWAVWMKNLQAYCIDVDPPDISRTTTGEIDIVETRSSNLRKTTSTTHIGCDDGKFDSRYHSKLFNDPNWLKSWHIWSVVFDNQTITYLVDSEPIKVLGTKRQYTDSRPDFARTSDETFNAVINQLWKLVINGEVYTNPSAKNEEFRAPDITKPFPPQAAVVDYVRVFMKK